MAACPVSCGTLSVDGALERFTSLEAGTPGSAAFNRLASLRVAPSPGSALFDGTGTKAYQNNRITFLQSTSNGLDDGVQSTTGGSFRNIGRCSNGIDQFRLVHSKSPYTFQRSEERRVGKECRSRGTR